MALKWGGFSEDDIRKAKSCPTNLANDNIASQEKEEFVDVHPKPASTIFPDEKLQIVHRSGDKQLPNVQENVVNSGEHEKAVSNPDPSSFHSESLSECDSNFVSEHPSQINLSKDNTRSLAASLLLPVLSHPISSSMSTFGAKQKLMEEKNRLRKVYLSKALEDRKKQTQEEQQRLNKIQAELQKLDQRLSNDVSIIRDQIETASVEFMEAQKRYDRAEKEFLDAKFLLYTKLERKELLTHHLCTIIEQNEMRKAQKLSELMEKLNLPDNTKEDSLSAQSPQANHESLANSPEIILTPSSVAVSSPSIQE